MTLETKNSLIDKRDRLSAQVTMTIDIPIQGANYMGESFRTIATEISIPTAMIKLMTATK